MVLARERGRCPLGMKVSLLSPSNAINPSVRQAVQSALITAVSAIRTPDGSKLRPIEANSTEPRTTPAVARERKKRKGLTPVVIDFGHATPARPRDAKTRQLFETAQTFDRGVKGKGQNKEKASEMYRQAAERGDAEAQYIYAYMLDNGEGVAKDHQAALNWYKCAAETGNLRAIHELAFKFDHGLLGVEQHSAFASDLYRLGQRVYQELAATGDTAAEYRVGRAYLSGEYGTMDEKRGREFLGRAAAKGHVLAHMLLSGLDKPKAKQTDTLAVLLR